MKKLFSALKLLLTLKCEESTHLVSDSLDRDLSFVERWAVRLHYISCWSCRRFGHQVKLLRAMLQAHPGKSSKEEQLSTAAIQRIRDAIDAELY